ncbi:hypothetical protein KQH42_15600 [Streptomyces sp. CHA1]|uniref:DUF6086 family protein n=1 Tax=Streptomyces TaxID=1883 RepID=UPI0003C2D3B5|nr:MULTISPECIES: DUF6086 family protein [unclassified Streptomyces]QPA00470.1 hypothetical protein DI273_16830 [Streptomyces violascens]UYM24394.1 DUF6086 family protein [Streptomyces albus]WDV32305.1 DUF6086 family protein [Streptomyces sp. AD16]WSB21284.1 DUF6086 family protein [Streptomyces albidoflavus]ESP98142.1 Hypothetical protein B591_16174 [Streptomyces sp. GBA 94-10 4N24]
MSQYYEVGDETLWNPSIGASRLFLAQVRLHEDELGLASGLGPMDMDECKIEAGAFREYTEALVARHLRTGHRVILALSEGFVATVLVLARRAGIEPDALRAGADGDGSAGGFRDVQVRAGAPAPPGQGDGDAARERLEALAHRLDRAMPR